MKLVLVLVTAAAAGWVAEAPAQNEPAVTREGEYWVRNIHGLLNGRDAARVRVITVGNVILKSAPSDSGSFSLKARVKARDERQAAAMLRGLDVRTRVQDDTIVVVVATPRSLPEAPELSLSLPQGTRSSMVETHGGNIQANDVGGNLEARSAGGKITADGIAGNVDLRTGGGDIEVGTVRGAVHSYSGGGEIRVQSAGGEARLETAGGEIFIHEAKGPVQADTEGGNIRVDSAASTVAARTAAGLIQVQRAGGTVTAESSGGAIQVNSAHGVHCDSAAGPIRLSNVAGPLRASTNAGSILTELAAGDRIEDSSLSTNAGDITVMIAAGVALTVMARNDSGGMARRIVSDFSEIRVRPAAQMGPLVAEGALNGGGPVLHINVNGGTIYLRRQK